MAAVVFERWWARDIRGGVTAVCAGVSAFVLPNLVLAAVNADGWWATYGFHSARGARWYFAGGLVVGLLLLTLR